jgi:ABC-2 type transport system ATP-binding protein
MLRNKMVVIETQDLRKVYGETVAVEGLSLSLNEGEAFGFLGANGAGKTTTIKMLLGLVRPTAGQARLLGRAPGDPAVMGQVGFLPEHFRFHPWLTANDFLDLHARLYRMDGATRRQRIHKLLERVGLGDRAHSKLGEFSKGMLQRIGLAQALLNEPRVVFLDEPTSGLDPLGRREVRDLIRELRAQGVTIFLNSHLLGEVEATCDRIAIVKRGRIACLGALDELTRGSVEVEMHASGLTPELRGKLEGVSRVLSADGDRFVLAVEQEEQLPAIARLLVEGGAQLYALSPRRLSLEELFMRVMKTDKEQP